MDTLVIMLHDIARTLEQELGKYNTISESIRKAADDLSELIKKGVV